MKRSKSKTLHNLNKQIKTLYILESEGKKSSGESVARQIQWQITLHKHTVAKNDECLAIIKDSSLIAGYSIKSVRRIYITDINQNSEFIRNLKLRKKIQ